MSSTHNLTKRPGDLYIVGVDFTAWPLNTGETLTTSNTRGSLTVTATDEAGVDITASVIKDPPAVDATGTQVLIVLYGGSLGDKFFLEISVPTSDDELLTEQVKVLVKN